MTEQHAEQDAPVVLPRMTFSELTNSLTGWDEQAIVGAFHQDLTAMPATMMMRAAFFVLQRRAGVADKDAYRAAMSTPFGAVGEAFDEEPEAEVLDEGKA